MASDRETDRVGKRLSFGKRGYNILISYTTGMCTAITRSRVLNHVQSGLYSHVPFSRQSPLSFVRGTIVFFFFPFDTYYCHGQVNEVHYAERRRVTRPQTFRKPMHIANTLTSDKHL